MGLVTDTTGANSFDVKINRPDIDGRVVDYSLTPLVIDIDTISKETINIDGTTGAPLLEASGKLNVSVSDFFKVSGSFSLRRSATNIKLADGTTKDVSLLTLGVDGRIRFCWTERRH
jgi:hypothetical protein